jgi:putative transposase
MRVEAQPDSRSATDTVAHSCVEILDEALYSARVTGADGEQLALRFPNRWGGARRGAGRKAGARRSTPHRARPTHRATIPQHVTLRQLSRSLRSQFVFPTVRGAIDAANRRGRGRFQIVHFSVQSTHLHLIVEARDRRALIEGIRGFNVSLARRVNRLLFRRGRLLAERWHVHALTSPRAVRRALVYVLANAKKHGESVGAIDPLSSAPYFCGFREFPDGAPVGADPKLVPRFARSRSQPLPAPRSWLLGTGWLRCERISICERPSSVAHRVRGRGK